MNSKLTNIKNIAWAAAIVLCLFSLLVGLGFAAFTRNRGELQRPTVLIGQAAAARDEAAALTQQEEAAAVAESDGQLHLLGASDDAGQAYIDSLTFLCDSALIGLRDYGLLSGGTATTQVWGSAAGNIPAVTLADFPIRYPGDGSEISAADAAMIARPGRLLLSLGTDGLRDTDRERFIADYEALIRSLREASPDTVIAVSSITSVTISYSGNDGLDFTLVNQANEWLQQICAETGVYFVDAARCVSDSNGSLLSEYASANGKTLNSAGLNQILQFLRTHVMP